ncbi:Sodium/hydrogen exchanger family-domain-containing protein [Cladochytrium replicatum]|nr:Sodium/hydrogen exchanger family-domain-containing protein [Cladochytrium replicatum]
MNWPRQNHDDPPYSTTSPLPSGTASPSPSPDPSPHAEEIISTWAILILISLLFITLLTSYYLQRKRIKFIHETVVSIFLGLVVGLVIRLIPSPDLQRMVSFDHKYFFNLLLPPIILNSGYDMKRKDFFRNFGSILTFAFLGTFISTVIIACAIYLYALLGINGLKLSFLDAMVFGAILSSTDPVTVLAIFHQNKVDPKLYAIIFGESLLNDSVAIVLFSTLGQFKGKEVTLINLAHGIGTFMAIFFGSVMIGLIVALICALMLKHSHLHQFPSLESCLVFLLAYSSYLLSNGIQLSGIVSLLFCGIALKHYAYDNMSMRSRRTTKYMFRVLSQMSENFIFIYLGVTLFTKVDEQYYPVLIIFTLGLIMAARYVSVVPLSHMINWINTRIYQRDEVLPRNHQLMLWWAGLRGAIAFALAFEVGGESGNAIRSTTLVVCVVTIILLGGTTHQALMTLNIRTGVGEPHGYDAPTPDDEDFEDIESGSSDDDVEDWNDDGPGSVRDARTRVKRYGRHAESDEVASMDSAEDVRRGSGERLVGPSARSTSRGSRPNIYLPAFDEDMTHWFISFDNRWLKPLFTRTRWKWGRSMASGYHPRVSTAPIGMGGTGVSPSREGLLAPIGGGGGGTTSSVRQQQSSPRSSQQRVGSQQQQAQYQQQERSRASRSFGRAGGSAIVAAATGTNAPSSTRPLSAFYNVWSTGSNSSNNSSGAGGASSFFSPVSNPGAPLGSSRKNNSNQKRGREESRAAPSPGRPVSPFRPAGSGDPRANTEDFQDGFGNVWNRSSSMGPAGRIPGGGIVTSSGGLSPASGYVAPSPRDLDSPGGYNPFQSAGVSSMQPQRKLQPPGGPSGE